MDTPTKKFYKNKKFYFILLKTGKRKDWWLWDVEDGWVVATVVTYNPDTFAVTLRKGSKVYKDIPIYRLYSGEKEPSEKALAVRIDMIAIVGGKFPGQTYVQPTIKF